MKKITLLLIAVFISASSLSQNNVSVDGSQSWNSFVAAFNVSDGNFDFGFSYDVVLAKTTLTATTATLQPNFEIWETNNPSVDPGWFNDATTPNKIVEVSSFIEDNSLAASDLTFSGNIDSYTISVDYEVEAFIKALDPNNGFATTADIRVTLNDGDSNFSVSATAAELPAGFVIQYGFSVTGLIASPATGASLGSVVVSSNITTTCDNGVQDGDETGVDCGGSCAPCATPPTVAAPTPPARASADVVNVYSAAYAGSQVLTPDTFGVAGNNSTATEGSAEGDDFWGIVFDGGDFVGFNLNSGVDASEMTHFHMDYWTVGTPTGGVMNPKWSNHSGGHLTSETHAAIHTFAPGQDGQWNSLDIEISEFSVGILNGGIVADRSVLSQLIMQASGASAALFDEIYFDNVYFHKNTTLSNDSFSQAEFRAYPNPTQDVWNIRTSENIQKVEVYNITGRLVKEVNVNASEASINASELSSGIYLAKISNEFDQTRTIKLIKE